jgi:hypothetical protein
MFVIYLSQYLDYKFCKLYVASYPYPADFFVVKFHHFAIKKSPKQHGQGEILGNFTKE